MMSIALVIALGGMARASYGSIMEWMRVALNPDLFVTASEKITVRTYRFPASMADELRAMPGVADVQLVRDARIVFRGNPVMLVAADIGGLKNRAKLPAVEGNNDEMYRLAADGKGVIVSDNLATLRNIHLGDQLEIPSPRGPLKLPVAGVVMDYSDQQGSMLIDRRVFIEYWNDDTVDLFRVYVSKGSSIASVRQSILDRFGSTRRLFVLTNEDLRSYIIKITDQWFGVTYLQIAVAILVAVLGIVNTLTVSITDRRRELGVLQAVGAIRKQIRWTIWMESLTIGFVGLMCGLALGAVQLFYVLEISRRDVVGLRLNYEYPVEITAYLFPVMLGAAFIAAVWPAESAVRGSLVEALEYE
jgi:putative ABC transport system permease protein